MREKLEQIFRLAVNNKASDIHLITGYRPQIRINSEIFPLTNFAVLEPKDTEELATILLDEERQKKFLKEKELDFSYVFSDQVRFRINAYFQKDSLAFAFRLIPFKIPSIEELNLPIFLKSLTDRKQGFILVTGPSGHGKSTTIAAMIEEINNKRPAHIITIEDPIEYFFQPKKAIFSQREVSRDTISWQRALGACLREDPDVVFVGEMRDLESISAALTIAETGHLVFSTLHTNSAPETIDRIVDVFPEGAKNQARLQLASSLGAIISQRLVPTIKPGRVPAVELLINNYAVKTAIREAKTHMIDNIIQTSAESGMFLLEVSLAEWVKKGVVDSKTAEQFALREKELLRNLRVK
jgi:twitching motility protein PilT